MPQVNKIVPISEHNAGEKIKLYIISVLKGHNFHINKDKKILPPNCATVAKKEIFSLFLLLIRKKSKIVPNMNIILPKYMFNIIRSISEIGYWFSIFI